MTPVFSIVIPIFNEAETLPELANRLTPVIDSLDDTCEVVLVDDGSTDESFELMRRIHDADTRYRVLRLSRNFGHQVALTAGLDHARGAAVILMDGDLQDPPEVIEAMVEKWRAGYQVVYAVRDDRDGESKFKLSTARWFYRFIDRLSTVEMPVDAGDFRLVDRMAVDSVNAMGEHHRYLRGMFAWVGYDQIGVHYSREARFAGETKYPLRKMLGFATDAIVSFSTVPLRIALMLGFVVSFIAVLGGVIALLCKVFGVAVAPGWVSIVFITAFLGGIQLVVLGFIGEYIARIHEEVKQRPQYLLRETLDADSRDATASEPRSAGGT
ncbi:MAG: glycosyltransferase family 2 protein [Actinobacteria bacterium]|nr:glycosyltransferase family 2 protein [Actinomycetota bacterium]